MSSLYSRFHHKTNEMNVDLKGLKEHRGARELRQITLNQPHENIPYALQQERDEKEAEQMEKKDLMYNRNKSKKKKAKQINKRRYSSTKVSECLLIRLSYI